MSSVAWLIYIIWPWSYTTLKAHYFYYMGMASFDFISILEISTNSRDW